MSAEFARIKHLLADGVFRRLVHWFFIVRPMTISSHYKQISFMINGIWTITLPHIRQLAATNTVVVSQKCHWPWTFYDSIAKNRKRIHTACCRFRFWIIVKQKFPSNQYSIQIFFFSLFVHHHQFDCVAIDAEPNSQNEINLNSNTVLSLFIFKQPSGSKKKLKFIF